MSVRVGLVAIFAAIGCFQDVASYNPYAYNPSYFPKTTSDSYSTMGDINWAKRANRYSGVLKSLMEPSYGYASMADANWGWKKRSDDNLDEESPDVEALSAPKRGFQRSYKYRQPYMRARPRADRIQPYQAYARYGAIARPQTRKLGDRQYAFYSMADAPWGWKKRSVLPAFIDDSEEDTPMEEELEKRNVAAMARSNMFPVKRSYDESSAGDENNLDLIEEASKNDIKE